MGSNYFKRQKFQNGYADLRMYNPEIDPEKLVKYLYDKMNTKEGIQELRNSDKRFITRKGLEVRFVVEFQGDLIATSTLNTEYWNKKGYHMYSVVTAPQYRGSGISSMLFQFICEWVKLKNKQLITTDTYGNNYRAQGFFKKMEFIQFGCIPNIIEIINDSKVDHLFYYYLIK